MSGNGHFPGNNPDNRWSEDDWEGQYAYPKKPEPAPPAAPRPQQHQGYAQHPGQQAPQSPGYQGYPGQNSPGPAYPNQSVQGYPAGQHHAPAHGHNQFGSRGQQPPQQKSRVVAGLLGIFLGGFGVHRFYLGNTPIGIAQVALTVLGVGAGAVWGFVEGVMILCNARAFRTDARGIPLK